HVVEPDPDMPDAVADVVDELREARDGRERDRQSRLVGAEDRGRGARGMLEPEQAAVRRIEVGEQRVLDVQAAKALRFTARSKAHDGVGAVAVLVYEMLDRGKRARSLVGADPQPCKCVGGN